jgi:hypothetical protein
MTRAQASPRFNLGLAQKTSILSFCADLTNLGLHEVPSVMSLPWIICTVGILQTLISPAIVFLCVGELLMGQIGRFAKRVVRDDRNG